MFGEIAQCNFKNLIKVPSLPSYTEHLYLDHNRISVLDSKSLQGLPLLERLDLGAQRVRLIIRNDTFQTQQRLKTLILGSNRRLRLEPRAFAGLDSLRELYLDYCDLTDSILSGNYLQWLPSLETLDLSYNQIERVQPAGFFSTLRNFTVLSLEKNQIVRLCKEDFIGFQGKIFTQFNLGSNNLFEGMSSPDFDWEKCGNPFRNVTFKFLDLSTIGFNATTLRLFFKAIDGTSITSLRHSGILGRGFSFRSFPDPDKNTFEGLRNSSVEAFDLAGNYIFALQEAVFSSLTDAIFINASFNKINQINRGAFKGLQNNLRLLNLSFNLLGEIYSYTFDYLTDLRVLDLSYNHIGALGHQAFSGLPFLKQLDLKGNSLRKLGSTASLPSLLFLYLNDNRLGSLWGINNLVGRGMTHLAVEDNRLNFLNDVFVIVQLFPHLKRLVFGGNFIKWCESPTQAFENNSLALLDLRDSSLQVIWAQGWCLDIFQYFSKLLGLNLKDNSLTFLPQGIFNGLHSIIEIDLSFNDLTYLQPDAFPLTLNWLDLSNNFLATPNPDTFRHLAFINLAGNRFYCDCNLEGFLWWLNSTSVMFLSPVEQLQCGFPLQLQNLPLQDYSTIIEPCEEEDEKALQDLRLALFILSTVMIVSTMLGALVYARVRGHIFVIYKKVIGRVLEGPKPPEPEENIQYDAFVCYSDADYQWVERALLKKLDSGFSEENLFRCCFEARDFLPGEDHLVNIRDAIWGSRKTVCVVSREFLKDGWCLEAFTLAQGRKLEELSNVLIMIVVGRVAHFQLMRHNAIRAFVQSQEYLVWPEDPQDMDWFYDRLTAQILKDNKRKKKMKEGADKDRGQPEEHNDVPMEIIRPQAV